MKLAPVALIPESKKQVNGLIGFHVARVSVETSQSLEDRLQAKPLTAATIDTDSMVLISDAHLAGSSLARC